MSKQSQTPPPPSSGGQGYGIMGAGSPAPAGPAFASAQVYDAATYREHLREIDDSRESEDCSFIKASFKTAPRRNVRVATVRVLKSEAHVAMSGDVQLGVSSFDEIDPWWVRVGSLADNFTAAGVRFKAGLCAIVGGGGVGKTPLAHALAGHAPSYSVVRFGEPFAGYTTDSEECAFQLADALYTQRAVVFDSVKDILAGGGSAMKSGLSREALVALSSWSIAAANCGSTLFVPVNPSTSDPETLDVLIEALKSNVSAVIFSSGPEQWEYSCRTREGGNRVSGRLSATWEGAELRLEATGFREIAVFPQDVSLSTGALPNNRLHRGILASLQRK